MKKLLGLKPPKRDSRNLKLARYAVDLPAPAPRIDHGSRVPVWPMFLNDELGICGPAGAAHQLESWTTYAERGTLILTDDVVRQFYFDLTGGVDSGVYLLDMLRKWRTDGLGPDRIEAFVEIDPTRKVEVQWAIEHFGSAGLGLSLPDQGTFGPWTQTYGPPNPRKGHYAVAVAYDENGLDVITWGEKVRMSWAFLAMYTTECFAVLDDIEVVEATMKSPEGWDFAQLEADLAALPGAPVDPPNTPPTPVDPGKHGCGVLLATGLAPLAAAAVYGLIVWLR
jgi:hypothetical protein